MISIGNKFRFTAKTEDYDGKSVKIEIVVYAAAYTQALEAIAACGIKESVQFVSETK